jgi:hypothetical protein
MLITVITNIINSFGAEIGAVLVFKLGPILGIALRTELGTALRELCTIVDIKLEDSFKLGSKLETILDVEIKLGSKLGTVVDRELCTVAADIQLGSKLGTILDRGHRTVVVLRIKLGIRVSSKLVGMDFRVLFLQGCISLKNWSYCPLLRDSTSPFKSTCLLIRGGPYLKIEEQPFSTLTRGVGSNPARVKAQEEVHETGIMIFKYSNILSLFEYRMWRVYRCKFSQS